MVWQGLTVSQPGQGPISPGSAQLKGKEKNITKKILLYSTMKTKGTEAHRR